MLDHLIKGATVVDGTGTPSYVADVGLRDGRIAAVAEPGSLGERARSAEDATGLVLGPGFVDPHTHYDAQLFWDPYATPSMNHGVTTVAGGNCGFTLAPLNPDRPGDADYTRRMMSRVEGMSLVALEEGAPWNWHSFGEYLDALEGRIAVNAGFMVGHCALRRHVMGPDAIGGTPTPDQLDQMLRLFHEAMDAGAWGLSTTQSSTHADGDGQPVASRHARPDELLALSRAVGDHEGTQIEAIVAGCLDRFADEEIDLLVEMSAAAGRPLNWNVLTIDAAVPERVPRQLQASERARKAGGRIVALTMPILTPMNMSLGTFCALNLIPGWGDVLGLPIPERIAKLRDGTVREEMLRRAKSPRPGSSGGSPTSSGTSSAIRTARPTPDSPAASSATSPPNAARTRSTPWWRSAPPTRCAPSCGRCRPTTTRPAGSCGGRPGNTRTSCSAAPTRAPTWTACAAPRTPRASSATASAAANCSRWSAPSAC